MQILILSDIHGNLTALNAVLADVQERFSPDMLALLGDLIDYGPRSNAVLDVIRQIPLPLCCNLWGNHEQAIMTETYTRFSSPRGAVSAQYTRQQLSAESLDYLRQMPDQSGTCEFTAADMKMLAVHGSLADPFWRAVTPDQVTDAYQPYDYVLSGHNHCAHAFPFFYPAEDPAMRNRKRTFFINPGSVGQPRNHDPRAQYAVLDTERGVSLCAVCYDIAAEQQLYTDATDPFYRDRLTKGV